METSKLYSEIENTLNSELSADTENVGDYVDVPYVKYIPEAAKSIEQLVIDKMEVLADFIHKNYELSSDSGYWITKNCTHKHPTKELIQLYLNK